MAQSLTGTMNVIASVVTILGGAGATLGAFTRWRARQKTPAPQPLPSRGRGTYPPPTIKQPAVKPQAQPVPRGVSHPVILSFALAGLLAVILYSAELLINDILSDGASTGVTPGSPLSYLNAALVALNLVCVIAVCMGVMVTANRIERPGWVATGVVTLLVALVTIGVFSVVALAPAVYYGLSGPRAGR
jgi:hypothetical protein